MTYPYQFVIKGKTEHERNALRYHKSISATTYSPAASAAARCRSASYLMDGVLAAGPGTSVYMPKGHFHTFKNISKQTGEQLMFVYPAGIEQFFWEIHELDLKMPQDFRKRNELANSKYGINQVPDHDFHAGTCEIVKALK